MCEATIEEPDDGGGDNGDDVGTVQQTVRPCNEVAGDENNSQIRQKTFPANTTETVHFTEDINGTNGQASVNITRIDKTPPQATTLLYTPNIATT
jgi:hypothetical protein